MEAERGLSYHEIGQDPLLQEFRMRLMMASEPDIPHPKLRARLHTAVHEADVFARATQPLMERRGAQRLSRCRLCGVYGHDASASNVRGATRGITHSADGRKKTATELIRQRRSIVVRRITDIPALDQLHEEGERGGARTVCAVKAGAENVPGGALYNLLPHARTADEQGELRGLLDGNRRSAIDLTAVRQGAAVHV
ncbi:selenocysteine-tRNA-specific elongation factor [Trypanosoma cruzi]|nr:selenocysteine-tRNA-specific elongation factor [Trypanosoma cruzi]